MTCLIIAVIFLMQLKGGRKRQFRYWRRVNAQSHGTMFAKNYFFRIFSFSGERNVSRNTESRKDFGILFRDFKMNLKKFLGAIKINGKAQAALEYFIILTVIALLTLVSISTFLPTVRDAIVGPSGFFQKAVGAMRL